MQGDTVHTQSDYKQLAQSDPAFQACGYLMDVDRHISQSGVLVSPTLFVTAAHGVINNKNPSSLHIGFESPLNHKKTVRVKKITFHPHYDENESGLFDMAILELEESVKNIKPIPFMASQGLSEPFDLIVVTFGSKDVFEGLPIYRRAFYLLETDLYYYPDRTPDFKESVAFSSVFFSPYLKGNPQPLVSWIDSILNFFSLPHDSSASFAPPKNTEQSTRSKKAYDRWVEKGKPPYALALPGSSGAPVFIKINDVYYLFGLITSFSHLTLHTFQNPYGDEANYILSRNKKDIFGKYQTVFSSFYTREQVGKNKYNFAIDQNIQSIVAGKIKIN